MVKITAEYAAHDSTLHINAYIKCLVTQWSVLALFDSAVLKMML